MLLIVGLVPVLVPEFQKRGPNSISPRGIIPPSDIPTKRDPNLVNGRGIIPPSEIPSKREPWLTPLSEDDKRKRDTGIAED
jgi:hypothetical protein